MINFYIDTPNLIIRSFSPNDSNDVSEYSQKPKVSYWMSDMVLKDEAEALSWINWINKKNNLHEHFIILAIEHKKDGKCIGVIGIQPKAEIDKEVEILYAISDDYQSKGYATEASTELINWAFENTNLKSLSAIVKPENTASKVIIEKLNFKYIDTKIIPYDGNMCKFNYYKLHNS